MSRSAATTRAIGPNGRTIHFDDLVSDGEIVEVGGRRMRVYYDPEAPDWFVEDERPASDAATTRRVNVNFSGEAWEALRYLADVRGSTISDVLRRSLATLKWAHDVQREGAHFIREDANGKRTEVIFL